MEEFCFNYPDFFACDTCFACENFIFETCYEHFCDVTGIFSKFTRAKLSKFVTENFVNVTSTFWTFLNLSRAKLHNITGSLFFLKIYNLTNVMGIF